MSEVEAIETIAFFVFFSPFFSIEYFFGNISLLLKFGNNPKNGDNRKKYSLLRRAFAYGIYGFGLDILFVYTFPQSGTDVVRDFIFEGFYEYIGILGWLPYFFLLFAIIGYIIEKHKGDKTR